MDAYLYYNWWISIDTYLTQEHRNANALNIYAYLKEKGWTTTAIAAATGNFDTESSVNPGFYQGYSPDPSRQWWSNSQALKLTRGYGLAQWTPAGANYMEYCITQYGAEYQNGWMQVYRFTLTKGHWQKSKKWNYMTFQEFISNTDKSLNDMTDIWTDCYEKLIGADRVSRRKAAALYYNLFISTPDDQLPPVPVNPVHPDIPTPPTPPPGPTPGEANIPIWLLFQFRKRRLKDYARSPI